MQKPIELRAMAAFWVALILCCSCAQAQAQGGQPHPTSEEALFASAQALPQVLSQRAEALKEEINSFKASLTRAKDSLSREEKDARDLKISISAFKTSLALESPSATQAGDVVKDFREKQDSLAGRIDEAEREIKGLSQLQEEGTATLTTLKDEIGSIRTLQGASPEWSAELDKAYRRYVRLDSARLRLIRRLLGVQQQRLKSLLEGKALLTDIQPHLKRLDETWKVELMTRRTQLSSMEQVKRVWQGFTDLAGRSGHWLSVLIRSGRVLGFLRDQWPLVSGLLALIVAVWWGSRRLNRFLIPRLGALRKQTSDVLVQAIWGVAGTLTSSFFQIGLVLWIGLAFWTLGLLGSVSALVVLFTMAALVVLRLLIRTIQVFFAGKERNGLLPIEEDTARYYRRFLKLFSVYAVLGGLGLLCAGLLGFPAASLAFLEYLFEAGLLMGTLWPLRGRYPQKLLEDLPGFGIVRWMWVIKTLRGLILLALGVIVLSALLGFQSLAVFVTQGAIRSEGVVIVWALLMLGGREALRLLLHPEDGWLAGRSISRVIVSRRLDALMRRVFGLVVTVAALLAIVVAWGVKTDQLPALLGRLTTEVAMGPMRLSMLNLALAALALYAAFWGSRLFRSLLEIRVFPRAGWDMGVRYTISTVLQYVMVTVGVLLALSMLGFPLANLALVAGALGVGVGFGLQNIVSNFVSGLILLFERPIKVGDMLVIDGQWGEVKEIRIRSTVFQTFDRYVLIIPNSELLSSKILNWTHYGRKPSRLALKVGVSYDSNVREVTQVITEVCKANPRVLDDPAPQVFFQAYGDSSLDFNVWVHVHAPEDRMPATHELNSAIFEAFQMHNIEIPFPQRDLHIKNWPSGLEKGLQSE